MKRLIPTDKEWFNYKDNKYCSWLFSFIASSATFYNGNLYYTKKQYIKDIPLIKKYVDIKNKKSIDDKMNKLIKLGYITEDKENYYIINHTDLTYLLIDRDLLYNICITKSVMTIQVFIYLMDKMNMKKIQYKENTYNFTIKELHSALGYSPLSQNNNIDNAIKECLQSLKAEGYINYYYDKVENENSKKGNYKIPNHILTFVCDTIPKQLQEVKKEDKKAETMQSKVIDNGFKF